MTDEELRKEADELRKIAEEHERKALVAATQNTAAILVLFFIVPLLLPPIGFALLMIVAIIRAILGY